LKRTATIILCLCTVIVMIKFNWLLVFWGVITFHLVSQNQISLHVFFSFFLTPTRAGTLHTHARTYTYARTHTLIRTQTHIHTHIHTHTPTHTQTHTHTHTHTYTLPLYHSPIPQLTQPFLPSFCEKLVPSIFGVFTGSSNNLKPAFLH
jgi:hypothetical protein